MGNDKNLLFSMTKSAKSKRQQLVVRISKELCIQARYIPSDRLDILIDRDSRIGIIKRVKEGGYAASAAGILKKNIKEKYYSVCLKITWANGMPRPSKSTYIEDVEVKPEGIYFSIPESIEI